MITWVIPQVEGVKRSQIGPCVVTLDGANAVETAVAIANEARIATASELGGPASEFAAIEEKREDELRQWIQEGAENGTIDLDYVNGRQVKLYLRIYQEDRLEISVNYWLDRFGSRTEAVETLNQILQTVCATRATP